ncbi:MAG: hypothetical protein AAF533_28970 [Acidobacteriota bacterium]
MYSLDEKKAHELVGHSPPYYEGTAISPTHPVRRLTIVVRFPSGYWPEDVSSHTWPLVLVPGVGDDAMEVTLSPRQLRLERDRKRSTLRLRVRHPPLGLQFGLSWRLPERWHSS